MARIAFGLWASVLAAGCFHPDPANGAWICSVGTSACPSGYYCAADDTCWKEGSDPSTTDGPVLDGGLSLALAGAPTYATSAPNPDRVVSGDFNGDKIDDVLVLDPQTASMDLWLGQKSGTLGALSTTVLGGMPTLLAAADFDGNGTLDIVVGGPSSATVAIWSGDGTGKFSATKTVDLYIAPTALAASDLDGNALGDIVSVGASAIEISFDANQLHTNAYNAGTIAQAGVAIGDVDGDGTRDVVTLLPTATGVGIYLNKTDFSFTQVTNLDTSGDTLLQLAVGDVTGDNLDDIVASSSTFVDVCVSRSGQTCVPDATPLPYPQPSALALADVDGDDHLDLVMAHGEALQVQGIGIALNTGNAPTFGVETLYPVGDTPGSTAVGDFDGDGRSDVAVVDTKSQAMSLVLGTRPASQPVGIWNPKGATATLVRPVVADVNADGKLDVILGQTSPPTVSVYLGNDDGTFSAGVVLTVDHLAALASADLDGDHKVDIITVGGSSLNVLVGKGGGSFASPVTTPIPSSNAASAVAIGDVDDDGKPDVVVAAEGDASLYVLHGTGTASPKTTATTLMVDASLMSTSVAIGDVDGDRRLDVVAASAGHSGAVLFLQEAGHALVGPMFVPSVSGARVVRLADLDGDDQLDLVLAGDGGLFTEHNAGGGVFTIAQKLVTANAIADVLAIDLTQDRRPELLAVSTALTQLLAFANLGATFAAAQSYTAGALPTFLDAGALYGSGKVDVLVASPDNGVALVRNVSK